MFRCPRGQHGDPEHQRSAHSTSNITATYIEEVPFEYFHQRYGRLPRVTVGFGFDGQRREFHESLKGGTDFQVFIIYYPGECDAPDGPAGKNAQNEAAAKVALRLDESLYGR